MLSSPMPVLANLTVLSLLLVEAGAVFVLPVAVVLAALLPLAVVAAVVLRFLCCKGAFFCCIGSGRACALNVARRCCSRSQHKKPYLF